MGKATFVIRTSIWVLIVTEETTEKFIYLSKLDHLHLFNNQCIVYKDILQEKILLPVLTKKTFLGSFQIRYFVDVNPRFRYIPMVFAYSYNCFYWIFMPTINFHSSPMHIQPLPHSVRRTIVGIVTTRSHPLRITVEEIVSMTTTTVRAFSISIVLRHFTQSPNSLVKGVSGFPFSFNRRAT